MNAIFESLLDIALSGDNLRLAQMKRAWLAYAGRLPKALKVIAGNPDDNVQLNLCRTIVDKGVSFLFGKDVIFEADDEKAQAYLDDLWRRNRRMSLLQKCGLNGGVCGHVFIKIQQQTDGIRLILLDPETITVKYAADDFEDVQAYVIQYPSVDPQTGKPVGVRQRIERDRARWRIIDERGDLEALNWRVINEIVHPYEFAPVVDCQNLPVPNEYWGMSDLEEDVIQAQQALNFILSNTARIIRFHAHPKTVGKGFSANQIQVGVDDTIVLPNPDADLKNLEMQSDLGSSLEFFRRIREGIHEMARIPEIATGKLDSTGQLSGVALQVLYQPLLEKTETKRKTYGDMLGELNRRLLIMGGFSEDTSLEIHWSPMLPSDPMQERNTALIDQQLGVSADTLLTRLGYDAELETQKRQAENGNLGEGLINNFEKGV